MIRGMIFDLDGTLLDSMRIWESAGEIYLRSLGKEPRDDLRTVLKPMSMLQAAEYIKEQYDVALPTASITDGINRTVEDYYLHLDEPKDGVFGWLEQLHGKNIGMCVATATDRYLSEAALTRCGIRDFFSEIFTCSEVGSGKESPRIYRKAAEHLDLPHGEIAVVEDSLHALRTAKDDGFMTVAVYDPYESEQEGLRDIADVYLSDFGDMKLFWRLASAE